jgi:predicted extracellular nuclease
VANCDLDVSPDSNLIQNGAPDAIALWLDQTLIDAVSYEGDTALPYTEGSGTGLEDDPSAGSVGISRCPNGTDSDQNNVDFAMPSITPGSLNDCSICGQPATPIHDIQGSGPSSPMAGTTGVHVEGVVIGDFQDPSTGLGGFFLQEEVADADLDPLTSEGVFVYDNGFGVDVATGDLVHLVGAVHEYSELTEMFDISLLEVCGSGAPIPPTDLGLPVAAIDDLEPFEGMLVTVSQTLYATEHYNLGRYGELWLSAGQRLWIPTNVAAPGPPALALQELNDRSRLLLDDGSTVQNPALVPYLAPDNTLRLGDGVDGLTGVMSQGFGSYRLHPTMPPAIVRVNERPAPPAPSSDSLTVASMNVLNYFNGDGLGGGFPTSRGADTLGEFVRQRDKLVSAILALDADIVGLMEIENDGYGTTSAIQDLVNGLNDAAGAGTFAFIDAGVAQIGADEIAVGLVYRPAAAIPVGDAQILDSTVDPRFLDSKNRPVLIQTFESANTGERLTVAVSHLKSKGSPCDDVGDPDLGDGQGNCSLTRTSAALALVDWLATDPTGSGDPDFLIIGDLNAYALEDPVAAIQSAGYENLLARLDPEDAYGYVFEGQAGYLDHALASGSLAAKVQEAAIWHINADEPRVLDYNEEFNPAYVYYPDAYRSSDHDPVLVRIRLARAVYLPVILNHFSSGMP